MLSGVASTELPVGTRLQQRLATLEASIEVYARAQLPSRWGTFEIFVFRNSVDQQEHLALVKWPPDGSALPCDNVPVRLHSECLTGDVLGSLRCDCREQLEMTLQALGQSAGGLLLYMRQEGRGIGLGNKIRAYALQQEAGLDTLEANVQLGFDAELRDYSVAVLILKLFRITSVQLATNNPHKIAALQNLGISVTQRLPVVTAANEHNHAYLRTKARKSGHLLPNL